MTKDAGDDMKPNATVLAVLAYAGLALHAAEPRLSSSDPDRGRANLQQTQDLVVGATKGLSGAQ
jgi:hypothetical protein